MWDEDLHMALCIVKVFALVVIAASLWNMSSSGYGYASDFGTLPQSGDEANWSASQSGYQVENSQAILQKGGFGNRYEAPVFWNIGDIQETDAFQKNKKNLGVIAYDESAAPVAPVAPSVGYATDRGVRIVRGYATDVLTPY